jgi:hypothetical protein
MNYKKRDGQALEMEVVSGSELKVLFSYLLCTGGCCMGSAMMRSLIMASQVARNNDILS